MKIALALICMLASGFAWAQVPAGGPVIRTKVDPAKGAVIGQPVQLSVEVLFPGEMAHPPRVSFPEAPGAQILRFETQATTMRDRIGDQDYAGQSFGFVLFARRGGEIAVPAPSVTFLDRSGAATGSAKGEAMRVAVIVPPGLDPSGPVLAADQVTVEQSWAPEPRATAFKPGSALVRSIRRWSKTAAIAGSSKVIAPTRPLMSSKRPAATTCRRCPNPGGAFPANRPGRKPCPGSPSPSPARRPAAQAPEQPGRRTLRHSPPVSSWPRWSWP